MMKEKFVKGGHHNNAGNIYIMWKISFTTLDKKKKKNSCHNFLKSIYLHFLSFVVIFLC